MLEPDEIKAKLQAPFPAEDVEWRVDRGQKTTSGNFVFVLAYITNRAIQNRLDEAFGPFGWRNEFREWKGQSQICGISVWDDEKKEWITKWDGSDDSNMDKTKGGLSGAMKRAAVQWGVGRYLYNLDQNRVSLKQNGENWTSVKVSKKGQPDEYITGYWDTPPLPAWALPEGYIPKQTTQPTTRPITQPQQPTKPPNAPQVAGLCSDCGNKITDGVKTVSEKKYGKPLCMNCQKKHQAVG